MRKTIRIKMVNEKNYSLKFSINNKLLKHLSTKFKRKIVIIFLPISLNMCFGAQKNRLNFF